MSTRRTFLAMGAYAGLAGIPWRSDEPQTGAPSAEPAVFRTPLCDLLGIRYPVVQAPMQLVASPALVAAVGEAGGIGVLAGVGLPPEDLRRQIRDVRALTSRPFGVNLILHAALRAPIDPATIPEEVWRAVSGALNGFRRRLGLAERADRPPRLPDTLSAAFKVIVDERVPLFSTGLGLPTAEMVRACRQAGIKVMSMVTTVQDAREAEALGVDLIVAQGYEAGGHRSLGVKPATPEHSAIGTLALVPQIARAVRTPVVAAGGIVDGRGLAAALMLGATGVLMGTRFIATRESGAPQFHKDALVAGDSNETTLSDAFTGHYARFLRNTFIEDYRASGAPALPTVVQQIATRDIVEEAVRRGDRNFYTLYAGQGVGAIDSIPSAADIVRAVVAEAREAVTSGPRRAGLAGH